MMSHLQQLVELAATTLIPAALGIAASAARVSRYGWKGMRHFIGSTTISVFTGVLAGWLMDLVDVPATVTAAVISICAYSGGSILDAVIWRAHREIRTAPIPAVPLTNKEQGNGST